MKQQLIRRELMCPMCAKVVQHKGNLTMHMKATHWGRRAHICPICRMTFTFEANLQKHIERAHVDTVQSNRRDFGQEKTLNKHVKAVHHHSLEAGHKRPTECLSQPEWTEHACPVCSVAFTNRIYLDCHLKAVHKDWSRFECSGCGQGFAREGYLRVHVHRAHPELASPHCACPICRKGI